MSNKDFQIRLATQKDYGDIYSLVKTAYNNANFTSGFESDDILRIRSGRNFLKELEFVAEYNSEIIAYIMLSVQQIYKNNGVFESMLATPLCVALPYRNQGIGKKILDYACEKAKSKGYSSLFAIGDAIFFTKYGFKKVSEFGIENASSFPDEKVFAIELVHNALSDISGKIYLH